MVLKLNTASRLTEASRKDLVAKSRIQSKSRFKKRLNYQVSNFRGVDLKQMFENDYFVFQTPIKDYVCVIAFPGVFTQLRQVVKETHGDASRINLQMVIKALRRAFDATDDVKVDCTCADFRYRYAYWATKNGYKYGAPETRPSDETNPDDMLGATCKHLDLLLSNKRWLTKAASVVNSFIKAYPEKASLYLYDEEDIVDEPEDEIVDDEVVNDEDEITTPFSDDDNIPPEETSDDEGNGDGDDDSSDSGKDLKDSLRLHEAMVDTESEFMKAESDDTEIVKDQRERTVDFVNKLYSYLDKYEVADKLKVLGYGKFSHRQNYVLLQIDDVSFWVYYKDGQYILNKLGFPEKANQNPQKIIKYITDTMIFDY